VASTIYEMVDGKGLRLIRKELLPKETSVGGCWRPLVPPAD
jgi:hypothetical protein